MNQQHFTDNGNLRFPLTTEALDFMQQQIFLLQGLGHVIGQRTILLESTATTEGLAYIDGELFTIEKGEPDNYLNIVETEETLTVADQFSGKVRTLRTAEWSPTIDQETYYAAADLQVLDAERTGVQSLAALTAALDEAKQHQVPTGAIMAWSGLISDIPTGWHLCDGSATGIPDLRGRFIVGACYDDGDTPCTDGSHTTHYKPGATGGLDKVSLTEAEMPEHTHTYGAPDEWAPITGDTVAAGDLSGDSKPEDSGHTRDFARFHTSSAGNGRAHENRPPFYALAFIIKLI
jgi:microcystin-dependent protein